MAFRLPSNLTVGRNYGLVSVDYTTALEESLPSNSRMLVGLVFPERYEGFEEDCERANTRLLEVSGLSTWQEYPRFVTPDPDGASIAWVSYQSSPAWWIAILVILGGAFLLPIVSVLPVWIIDKLFPGFTEMIGMITMVMVMGGLMLFMPKMLPAKEEK